MANEVVGIDITARLDKLRSELAKIPDIGAKEAKALAGELSREIKQAEKAAKDAAKSAQTAQKSMSDSGKQLGANIAQSKEAVSSLGAALSVVSPTAGAMVQQLGALGGAAKAASTAANLAGVSIGAIAAIAGPVVVVLGALALVIADVSRENRIAAELAATQRAAVDSLVPSMRALEDVEIALKVATGEYNAEQELSVRLARGAQRAVLDLAKAQLAQRAALQETIDDTEKYETLIASVTKTFNALNPVGWALELSGLADMGREAASSMLGLTDNAQGAKDQLQVLDDAILKAAAAQEEFRKKSYQVGIIKQNAAAAKEAAKADEEAADKARAAFIEDEKLARKAQAEEEAQRKAIEAYEEGAAARNAARAAERIAQEQAVAAARMSFSQKALADVEALARGVASEGKKGAMVAFRVAQASGIAQVGINTVVAASKALAELGPIGGAIAAGVVTAIGIGQAAAIASQSPPAFYTGGFLPAMSAPAGIPATLHSEEAVISKAARNTLGDDTIRRAERGEPPTSTAPMVMRADGREIAALVAQSARRGGKMADEQRRSTGRLGHSTR